MPELTDNARRRVTIGCDPEMGVLDRTPDGVVSYYSLDSANIYGIVPSEQRESLGNIGTDMGGRVVEFRPRYDVITSRVVSRLRKMFGLLDGHLKTGQNALIHREGSSLYYRASPNIKARQVNPVTAFDTATSTLTYISATLSPTRSIGTPAGGHVHLGFTESLDQSCHPWPMVIPCRHVSKALLTLFPIVEQQSRAQVWGTGAQEYRAVDWGENGMEYRKLPTFMASPQLAWLCLLSMKLAAKFPATVNDMFNTPHAHAPELVFRELFTWAARYNQEVARYIHVHPEIFPVVDFSADAKIAWLGQTQEAILGEA